MKGHQVNDFDGQPGISTETMADVIPLPERPRVQTAPEWRNRVGPVLAFLGGSFLWWMLIKLVF